MSVENPEKLQCYNKGCGRVYSPEEDGPGEIENNPITLKRVDVSGINRAVLPALAGWRSYELWYGAVQ